MRATTECSSCGRPIWWAVTAGGRRIPVDPDATADGCLRPAGEAPSGGPLVEVMRRDLEDAPQLFSLDVGDEVSDSTPLFMPHHATCPAADRHRLSGSFR